MNYSELLKVKEELISYSPSIIGYVSLTGVLERVGHDGMVEFWVKYKDFDYLELLELTYSHLKDNSEHDRLVYEAFKKNPKLYLEYYSKEIEILDGFKGHILIERIKDEKGKVKKIAHLFPI